MRIPRPVRAGALVALPAALLVSCSSVDGGGPSADDSPTTATASAATATAETQPSARTLSTAQPTPGPEKVRDAFAGLQATLDDSCTSEGQCAYFLGRVHDELERLDRAMKAEPKGPGHFPEPIAWIAELRETLGTDRTYPNLKKHQAELVGTRDRINVWMQDHPDDYR
ncbi:hypothetical protein [Streptomyces formicae]|uniref:Lipoprotein n=1 Tax=Streptomyces formicae TaxID=1616117 RepID=A0ABY3WS00_9ACTN|nr:hypothetical protein [Streptomyces formicae]UNM12563.1 hypothetical protein J4032_14435 [Streptomyces formicae]